MSTPVELLDRTRLEGLEMKTSEGRPISYELAEFMIERISASYIAGDDIHPFKLAQFALGCVEIIMATDERTDTDESESEEFKDQFIDLMAAHPNLERSKLIEHTVVARILTLTLRQEV